MWVYHWILSSFSNKSCEGGNINNSFIPIVTCTRTHTRFTHRVLKDITQRGTHYNIIGSGHRSTTNMGYKPHLHFTSCTSPSPTSQHGTHCNIIEYGCRSTTNTRYKPHLHFASCTSKDHNSSLYYCTCILACNSLKAIQGIARWSTLWILMSTPLFELASLPLNDDT